MANNDQWLRKIAAFLHDPPDKAFWHEWREIDALRFWIWATGLDTIPFYFSKVNLRKKDRSGPPSALERCFGNNWNDFVAALKNNNYGLDNLPTICAVSENRLSSKDQRGIKNHFTRLFHYVASSQMRAHLFGFENIQKDINVVYILNPIGGHSLLDVVGIIKEFDDSLNKEKLRNFLATKAKDLSNIRNTFCRFLTLWRNRHWISTISPADTRIPDHPVIDLETIQSAIAATLMEETQTDSNGADDSGIIYKIQASFLILEFGPVQKFIANARKTRDLWFSSWLISYLSWQAMKSIANELGPDNIVYPDLYKQPLVDDWLEREGGLSNIDWDKKNLKLPTLPNTFLAIVKEGDEKKFADAAKNSLSKTWEDLVEIIPNVETKRKGDDGRYLKLKEIWGDEVVDKFLSRAREFPFDVYWLGLKWGNDPEKAITGYKKLLVTDKCWNFGRLWSQIKKTVKNPNTGDTYEMLVQMAQTGLRALKYRGEPKVTEEKWQKCSLCGERSALVDLDLEKLDKDDEYVIQKIEELRYNPPDTGNPKRLRNFLYYKRLKDFWTQIADAFPGHIKENEHLCAVCLVKRLAPKVINQSIEESKKTENKSPFFDSVVEEFDYHYPSTGSIAIAPFIRDLLSLKNRDEIKKAIEKLNNTLNTLPDNFTDAHFTEGRTVPILGRIIDGRKDEGDFEPEWFYEESFQRFYGELEHQKLEASKTELKEIENKIEWAKQVEQAVKQVRQTAKEQLGDKYHLSKYYAAVYLDGDDLGKWISGELAPKIENVFHPDFVKAVSNNPDFQKIRGLKRPVTPAIHRAISSALRDFALEVVPYVVEHNLGVVVYSGGDDTLFLMPLENLLDTIITLRKLYSGERYTYTTNFRKFESDKGFIKIYEKDGNGYRLKEIIRVMGTKATLSAGVAIAHYLDPLDITLIKAHEALEAAKNKDEKKDKAGFKLMLHSGNESEAIVPWNFVEAMKEFKRAVESGLSSRFLWTLYREASVYKSLEDAFDAEFLKFGKRGQPESDEAELLLCNLIDARKHNSLTPDKFLEALLITDFLVREEGSK